MRQKPRRGSYRQLQKKLRDTNSAIRHLARRIAAFSDELNVIMTAIVQEAGIEDAVRERLGLPSVEEQKAQRALAEAQTLVAAAQEK